MNIAIYHNLPSGGAKRSLHEVLKRLSRTHAVDVYTLTTADEHFCDLRPWSRGHRSFPFRPLRLWQSPFGRLNQLQRWRDLRRLDHLAARIAEEIDSRSYDVVLVHPCQWTQAPGILNHLKTAALYYCQEPPRALYEPQLGNSPGSSSWRSKVDRIDPLIKLYRSAARRFDWRATRAAQRVLVNSAFTQRLADQIYGIAPVVSYHGVDVDVFRPGPGVRRKGYVLSVGAIQPHKGFAFLIESLAQIPPPKRPQLVLLGNASDPGFRASLETLAAKSEVALTIEIGVSEEDLVRRYNEALLLAYAPYNEPLGLAALEAMACGTPVIGVAEGGVRETVVDGETGLLVERDPRLFAKAIQSLLEEPALADRYGQQAQAYVRENWSWDRAVAGLEHHLRQVAGLESRHSS